MCPRNFKGHIFPGSSRPFVEKNVAQKLQVEKIGKWAKIQKTMSKPESLLIMCYHGNLNATFPFHLETFLARER